MYGESNKHDVVRMKHSERSRREECSAGRYLLVSCDCTMFMSISLGFSNDFSIASLVISWNTARLKGTYRHRGGRGERGRKRERETERVCVCVRERERERDRDRE